MKKLAAIFCSIAVVMLVGCACQAPQPMPMPLKGETSR